MNSLPAGNRLPNAAKDGESAIQDSERVKESKRLAQSLKGAKNRKGEVLSLLCSLCVLCALRETDFSVRGFIHTFSAPGGARSKWLGQRPTKRGPLTPYPLPASGERGVRQLTDGVWGPVRGLHPSADGLLNALPCGERRGARIGFAAGEARASNVRSTLVIASPYGRF